MVIVCRGILPVCILSAGGAGGAALGRVKVTSGLLSRRLNSSPIF